MWISAYQWKINWNSCNMIAKRGCIYKYSPGIHQQSMNHSEPYDFSNTHMRLPHLAYHPSPSFQCKAFVSHDSNLHAVHPIKRQAIPKRSNSQLRTNKKWKFNSFQILVRKVNFKTTIKLSRLQQRSIKLVISMQVKRKIANSLVFR
jgi:hypothetical protein